MSVATPMSWLGLEEHAWPPDYYTLLGLDPGEKDIGLIEQRVLEQLDKVRCHQLTNPERATELMCMMASAYACLSDQQKRHAYDIQIGIVKPGIGDRNGNGAAAPGTADPLRDLFDGWVKNRDKAPRVELDRKTLMEWTPGIQPPVRNRPSAADVSEPVVSVPLPTPISPSSDAASDVPQSPAAVEPPTVEPVRLPSESEARMSASIRDARVSQRARSGLGTRRAMLRRIVDCRELRTAWIAVGEYLSDESRLLNKRTAGGFVKQMKFILEILEDFPPLLGRDVQPGYLVVALARQHNPAITLQILLPSQRELLARDWREGLAVLDAHRDFLRQECRSLRKVHFWGRMVRAIRWIVADHPGKVLAAIAILAFFTAVVNSPYDWKELVRLVRGPSRSAQTGSLPSRTR